jgi:hypothetical protein
VHKSHLWNNLYLQTFKVVIILISIDSSLERVVPFISPFLLASSFSFPSNRLLFILLGKMGKKIYSYKSSYINWVPMASICNPRYLESEIRKIMVCGQRRQIV